MSSLWVLIVWAKGRNFSGISISSLKPNPKDQMDPAAGVDLSTISLGKKVQPKSS